MTTVVLDPACGGVEPGLVFALNGYDVRQADLNLALACRVAYAIRQRAPQVDVRMTRTDDETVSYAERARLVHETPGVGAVVSVEYSLLEGAGTPYCDILHTGGSDELGRAILERLVYPGSPIPSGSIYGDEDYVRRYVPILDRVFDRGVPAVLVDADSELANIAEIGDAIAAGVINYLARAHDRVARPMMTPVTPWSEAT